MYYFHFGVIVDSGLCFVKLQRWWDFDVCYQRGRNYIYNYFYKRQISKTISQEIILGKSA